MRTVMAAAVFGLAMVLAPAATPAPASDPQVANETQPQTPGQIALVDEGAAGFVFRHFPTRLRLYTFDGDAPGVSNCMDGCASRWPPVAAPPEAGPVGEWSIVSRADGRRQWAYRGRPVYLRYHDVPDQPEGDGDEGQWRLVRHMARP